MIKQEIKILENKLSDGDLLKLNSDDNEEVVTKVTDDDGDKCLEELKPDLVLNKVRHKVIEQSDHVGYDEKSTYWSTSLHQRGFQNLC